MIAAALLLAAAASAVDAERSFAAAAQTNGQWTAFRAYAAPEAIMFVPEPTNAQQWLAAQQDPKSAVMWWPGRSWQSCDGRLAVNTGPWVRRGGKASGSFTTVWQRQPDGSWKWLLDHGRSTPAPLPAAEHPQVARAACRNLDRARAARASEESDPVLLVQADDRMPTGSVPPLKAELGDIIAGGSAPDGSLRWEARALNGGEKGAHLFRLWQWNGTSLRLALYEVSGVTAP